MSELNLHPINRALIRPLLIAGVEKRLMVANCIICFPLVAATHFQLPGSLIGVALFAGIHAGLVQISKFDPHFSVIVRRASRYCVRPMFLAKSHISQDKLWRVNSLPVIRG